jgi:hypothetical protein
MIWGTIQHELLEMYETGFISDNQNYGVIVCVPKEHRTTKPEGLRHATLLNADLKLQMRILAKRLSPWLHSILYPSLQCGINGYTICEALGTVCRRYLLWNIQELRCVYYDSALGKCSTIYLTTNYLNIWRSMDSVIGSSDVSIICKGIRHHLHMSMVIGHINFAVKCSARQSCPISMQLFAICIDPFLYAIDATLNEIRIGRCDNKTAITSYGDDVTVLITSPDEVPKIREILDQYTSA